MVSLFKIRGVLTLLCLCVLPVFKSRAEATFFFSATQRTNLIEEGETSDTILTEGYLFTLTRDKLFTGGVGLTNPIGRSLRIHWPNGLEAQAVTAGPNPGKARIDLKREDAAVFSIQSLSFELLANTFGAGASLEIMPMLNGEDALNEPLMLNATGFYGMRFDYSTPTLTNYESYKITLYVDYAILALSVNDLSPARPALEINLVGSGLIELSYPLAARDYVLEYTSTLGEILWSTETASPLIAGDRVIVQIMAQELQRIYRLRK